MKKILIILLCFVAFTTVPTFKFSGTSHLQSNYQSIEMKGNTIVDYLLNIFDKKEKIYHNADLI